MGLPGHPVAAYFITKLFVQQLLSILKSDAFREKILSLGGYTVDNPGQIIPV